MVGDPRNLSVGVGNVVDVEFWRGGLGSDSQLRIFDLRRGQTGTPTLPGVREANRSALSRTFGIAEKICGSITSLMGARGTASN